MYVPTVVDVVVCSLAVYTSRAAGVILDCNRAFTALTGYTQEEVRSMPVHTGGMDYVVGCVLVREPWLKAGAFAHVLGAQVRAGTLPEQLDRHSLSCAPPCCQPALVKSQAAA